jgi:hypothetical protein
MTTLLTTHSQHHYRSCVWPSPVSTRVHGKPDRRAHCSGPDHLCWLPGELAMHLSRVESTGTNQPWNDKTLFVPLQKRKPSDRSGRGGRKYQSNTIYWLFVPGKGKQLAVQAPYHPIQTHLDASHRPLLPCPTKLLWTWGSGRSVS